MRIGEDDQFVPIGHKVFDACVIGTLGIIPVSVYLALRRYIWRDAEIGSRDMRQMVLEGKLASSIVQANLALSLGISRWSVNRAISKLVRLGWVAVQDVPGRVPRYILGEIEEDRQGRTYSRFWADGELLTLQMWLEAEAVRQHNGGLAFLSFENRIQLTERWFRQRVPDFFLPDDDVEPPQSQLPFMSTPIPGPITAVRKKKTPAKPTATSKASSYPAATYSSLEEVWREEFARVFSEITLAGWQVRERSQIKTMLDKYGFDVVSASLRYLCRRWDFLRARFFRGKGGVPSIGFLVRFHDVVAPEAQQWLQAEAVKRERDAWFAEHPHEFAAPSELEQRYEKIRSTLRSLGMEE